MEKPKNKKGIGGWLIVFNIILILLIFDNWGKWVINSLQGSGITLVDFLIRILLIIFIGAIVLILELKKSKYFPLIAIILVWLLVPSAFLILQDVDVANVSILNAIIWTIYFLRSKRVKSTFVK